MEVYLLCEDARHGPMVVDVFSSLEGAKSALSWVVWEPVDDDPLLVADGWVSPGTGEHHFRYYHIERWEVR